MDSQPVQEGRGPGKWLTGVLAFVVWLATAALGLVEIYLGRQTLVRILSHATTDVYTLTTVGHVSVFVLALVWIAYVILAGERGLRRIGKPKGWSIFIWAGAIEVLILILYFIV